MNWKQMLAVVMVTVCLTARSGPGVHGNGNGNGHNQTCGNQLNTVTVGTSATTYTYYGNQPRIKSIGQTTFTYNGNASVTQTLPNGTIITYNLDPATGLATSDTRGVTYTYDANQHCTQVDYPAGAVGSNPAFKVVNTIDPVTGNISRQQRIGWNDVTFDFAYTTIPLYENDQAYLGKQNTNWPLTSTEQDNQAVTTWDYTLDPLCPNRVSTQTTTLRAANGTVISTATYSYTYN